jgi:hypothetical protein
MQQHNASSALDRRTFLIAASTMLGSTPLALAEVKSGGILLQPRTQDLYRIRMEVEVKGNVNVPRNPLTSRSMELKLPIDSEASFEYEERLHVHASKGPRNPSEQVRAARGSIAAERYYHRAEAESTLNGKLHSVQLRDSVRDTIVRHDSRPEHVYAIEDFFRREELELLRTPVSSLAVDQLLPGKPIKIGSQYTISAASMKSVLNLTAVMACHVQAEVVAISDEDVKIQLRGNVDGAVDGVPTIIRTVGKLTFDRKLASCTWLAVALHETREVGRAEPGFDVSATIKMLRQPLKATIALPAVARKMDLGEPVAEELQYVSVTSEQIGFHVLLDRRWRMMRDQSGAAMMRMVENDRSIGQCDIQPVTQLVDDQPWSLPAFESNVQILLGEQFVAMVESDERVTASGTRVLRVVANGSAEGVPIRWVMMHLSDGNGDQIVATFTMEGSNIDAFGSSDMQFAGSIRFMKPAFSSKSPKGSAPATLSSNDEDLSQHVNETTAKQVADSILNVNTVR